ncbi:hypothetical protein FGO68_gene6824 [Halteria grandinella]|uniref:Uncharacterized protein n=1 Tax=Halteria grandinella TaxID=5974 RepID=A0A8J8N9Z6_HALGN|nr:hypothetical protein FGO68_gene6824 [Halteria grandinella]
MRVQYNLFNYNYKNSNNLNILIAFEVTKFKPVLYTKLLQQLNKSNQNQTILGKIPNSPTDPSFRKIQVLHMINTKHITLKQTILKA